MKKFNFVKGLVISLMAFALAFAAFGAVSASADEATPTPAAKPEAVTVTYDNIANTVTAAKDAVVYVLKQEKGVEIKANAKTAGTLTKDAATKLEDLKIKGTAKDVFLYVCDKEFEAADKVDANVVIKAQAAKKVTVKIDYTKADNANATGVISIVATDKDKKEIENATCVWCAEIDGTYTASSTFKGSDLAAKLAEGGEIYVKMVGADNPAQFASKVVKVKIAKQAKAPKAKYDQKKDTIALKNGFDFGLAGYDEEKKEDTAPANWFTVLPANKEAVKKLANESIVATVNFVPCDKKDAGYKNNTTQYKFKALSVDEIGMKLFGEEEYTGQEFTLAVRKSATAKKPASAVTYIKFPARTNAPIVFTADKVSTEYDVATTADFDKKGFVIGTIANYNGENGTEGFWNTFKLKETAGTGADTNAAAYEYLVVSKADYDADKIDWTTAGWSKLDPAKTKITSKLKAKYSDTTGKKSTAKLEALTKPEDFTPSGLPAVKSFILVRRAGVKGESPVRPSECVSLYVIKDGKEYILYSTVAVGTAAQAYSVDFYTLQKKDEAYAWTKDESIEPLKGWTDGDTVALAFPEIKDAKFYAYTGAAPAADATALVVADGKYTVSKGEVKIAVDVPVKVTYNLNNSEYNVTLGEDVEAPAEGTTKFGKITPAPVNDLVGTKEVEDGDPEDWKVTGWYIDAKCKTAVTADTVYAEAATIYAKWEKVAD